MMSVSMKQLLEAGVHFGHQTRRWNPKMAPFIFGERNGIHIIDLQKTVKKLKEAYQYVKELSASGETMVFVGTKKQAQDSIREEAERCGMPFVNHRWLGGLLTNFNTVKKSIAYLKELERMSEEELAKRSKKEQAQIAKRRAKLERSLGGIKNLGKLPAAIFVIDTKKENIAVMEARKLGVAVVAVVDTNCNPDLIDVVVPGNDDAIRAVKLVTSVMANAVLEGRAPELEGREVSAEAGPAGGVMGEEMAAPAEATSVVTAETVIEVPEEPKETKPEAELLAADTAHLAGDATTVAKIADELADEKVERIRTKRTRDEYSKK
jgi:small subunit ribosomal protein S2